MTNLASLAACWSRLALFDSAPLARSASKGHGPIQPTDYVRCGHRGLVKCLFVLALAITLIGAVQLTNAQPPAEPKRDPFGDPIPASEQAAEGNLADDPAHERELVKKLYDAADHPQLALTAMTALPASPTELELRALRNLDRELSLSSVPLHCQLTQQAVLRLATSGDATSLQYLHKVFDSRPDRRPLIADGIARFALAKQRRPHDWSLLVRSLTAVKGETAVRVLQALQKYRERGTSPTVLRNALLIGLELAADKPMATENAANVDIPAGAAEAIKLLHYWTNHNAGDEHDPIDQQLAAWQAWYHDKYPTLPAATLPVEAPAAPHHLRDLLGELAGPKMAAADAARGALVFEKALCIKCHTFGERGERIGPNLTKVTQRLGDEELLESLLFPNQQISDQYATKQLELTDGRVLAGIVGEQGDSVVVLPADAVKRVVPKSEIAALHDSPTSAMPSGLADKLSTADILDLFAYLRKVPE